MSATFVKNERLCWMILWRGFVQAAFSATPPVTQLFGQAFLLLSPIWWSTVEEHFHWQLTNKICAGELVSCSDLFEINREMSILVCKINFGRRSEMVGRNTCAERLAGRTNGPASDIFWAIPAILRWTWGSAPCHSRSVKQKISRRALLQTPESC